MGQGRQAEAGQAGPDSPGGAAGIPGASRLPKQRRPCGWARQGGNRHNLLPGAREISSRLESIGRPEQIMGVYYDRRDTNDSERYLPGHRRRQTKAGRCRRGIKTVSQASPAQEASQTQLISKKWSAPSDVTLLDGQTKGKFYMIKWNVWSSHMKTICLTVDLPNNKTLVAACTDLDEEHDTLGGVARKPGITITGANDELLKEILMTLTFNKDTGNDSSTQLLSISDVKYDIGNVYAEGHYNSAFSCDAIISWTTSVPATSEVNYIRNDEGFAQWYYSVVGKRFGDGCPEDCDKWAAREANSSCNTWCVNKINYSQRDIKLVTDHRVTLKGLYVGCATRGVNTYYKSFYFKVTSYDANGTKAESKVDTFQLLLY